MTTNTNVVQPAGPDVDPLELWKDTNTLVITTVEGLNNPTLLNYAQAWCSALGMEPDTAEQFLFVLVVNTRYEALTDHSMLKGIINSLHQQHPYLSDGAFQELVDHLHTMMQNTPRGEKILSTIGSLDTIPFQLPRGYYHDGNSITISRMFSAPLGELSEEVIQSLTEMIRTILNCFGKRVVPESVPAWYQERSLS